MRPLDASDAGTIGFGEIVAVMGEFYLIGLAILILVAAMAMDVPAGLTFIPIDDPAIAANFTA